jgi:hypothetical protein
MRDGCPESASGSGFWRFQTTKPEAQEALAKNSELQTRGPANGERRTANGVRNSFGRREEPARCLRQASDQNAIGLPCSLVDYAIHPLASDDHVVDYCFDGVLRRLGHVRDQARSGSEGLWYDHPRSWGDHGSDRFPLFCRTHLFSSDPVLFHVRLALSILSRRP